MYKKCDRCERFLDITVPGIQDPSISVNPDALSLELFLNRRYLDLAREGTGLQADRGGHPGRLPRHSARHHVPHGRVRRLQKRPFVSA